MNGFGPAAWRACWGDTRDTDLGSLAPALREEGLRSANLLGRQIDAFDQQFRGLIASDPDTDRRYPILTSVPGVGPVSVAMLCC